MQTIETVCTYTEIEKNTAVICEIQGYYLLAKIVNYGENLVKYCWPCTYIVSIFVHS